MAANNPATQSQARPRSAASMEEGNINPLDDVVDYMRTYARQKPEMAALWCFGIGFVLGWKLKPW
ncbi:hypothetical protein SH661x_004017 [Planctomicrobium sp. SH661]|uniref:hypothetical protein n=1 Tax=Planctomicrobium sp. SH661 TaxID=3448124 RepID=UPI003F5CA2AF